MKGRISGSFAEEPYWVFVCNPRKWAIDRFLERRIERDYWGVRRSDRDRFAPGQLGIVRVGVDQRTAAERKGYPRLVPGIYALCEVESEPFAGTGANDEFWARDQAREAGWPTVNIRYLRTYQEKPLTIERVRIEKPELSRLLLDGFQASSFPIPADDFHAVMELLGEEFDDLPSAIEESVVASDRLAEMERKYLRASPEVKERLSNVIERGPVGREIKRATGFKCQLCDALGFNPLGFLKRNGEPYVEAHHVMPVSAKQVGSLAASNVMILCANHHRQVHYGDVGIVANGATFDIVLNGMQLKIPRLGVIV